MTNASDHNESGTMEKRGYLLAFVKVNDMGKFKAYPGLVKPTIASFGGKALASRKLNDTTDILYKENHANYDMGVVLEFPTCQDATDWYHSDDYKEALGLRLATTAGPVVLAEGMPVKDDHKSLVMAFVTVHNSEGMSAYDPVPSVNAFGGRRLFKATPDQLPVVEVDGGKPFTYVVLLSFESTDQATAWIQSEEYGPQKDIRLKNSTGPFAILQAL